MKPAYLVLLTLAAALVAIASPAAADTPSNYLVLKGGLYSPSDKFDINNFNGGSTSRIDSKTGLDGEIGIGHYFSRLLAIELGGGYFESKGSPAAEPGETKLKVIPLLATGKICLPIGPIEPYGEFGIGAYLTSWDVHGTSSNISGSTKVTYGLHAGAGLNVNLTDHFFLGAEGRYLWAKPSLGGQDININGFTLTADLGLRF